MKPARAKYQPEFFYSSFPERRKVEWYKWEFLRRNPKYQADYRKFEDKHSKWLRIHGYWYDFTKRPTWVEADEHHFYAKIAPDIVRLCFKWRIGDLHPPKWRFKKDNDGLFNEKRPSGPATGFAPELNWDRRLIPQLLEMGFTGQGGMARRCGHLFLVEFDLTWPTKDQLDFTKRVLARAQDNYRRLLFGAEAPESARQKVVDHLQAAKKLISEQYIEIR